MDRFVNFLERVLERYTDASKHERVGQAAFNVLYQEDTKLANEIRGSSIDPFYDNRKLDAFFVCVEEAWMEESPQEPLQSL